MMPSCVFPSFDFNSTAIYTVLFWRNGKAMVFIQNMRGKQWQHIALKITLQKAFFILSEMYARFIENMVIFQLPLKFRSGPGSYAESARGSYG